MKCGVFYGQRSYPSRRVPFIGREKAAILKLRRKGCSINLIADFTGRSRATIHSILKVFLKRGVLRRIDLRKSPHGIKFRMASFRRVTMLKLWHRWEEWICEELEKPP